MIVAGIDPGVTGGISFLFDDRAEVYDIPVIESFTGKLTKTGKPQKRHDYNLPELLELLFRYPVDFYVIEHQHTFPGDCAFSLGKLMFGYGVFRGIFLSRGVDLKVVNPAVWKKVVGLPTKSTKTASRKLAMKLFPALQSSLTADQDDGRADSLLIAYAALHPPEPKPRRTAKRKK